MRLLPRSDLIVRRLLLVLIAIGLVARIGAGCPAAAALDGVVAPHAHCADWPARSGKPGKIAKIGICACASCAALPDSTGARPILASHRVDPAAAQSSRLAGMAGGPAPPPPRGA